MTTTTIDSGVFDATGVKASGRGRDTPIWSEDSAIDHIRRASQTGRMRLVRADETARGKPPPAISWELVVWMQAALYTAVLVDLLLI